VTALKPGGGNPDQLLADDVLRADGAARRQAMVGRHQHDQKRSDERPKPAKSRQDMDIRDA
jgi:hypothetical protein